jgi:hypothetical protein
LAAFFPPAGVVFWHSNSVILFNAEVQENMKKQPRFAFPEYSKRGLTPRCSLSKKGAFAFFDTLPRLRLRLSCALCARSEKRDRCGLRTRMSRSPTIFNFAVK